MKIALIIAIIGILLLLILYWHQFKRIHAPNVFLVTGGVKTGKSLCSLWISIMEYRIILIKYYIYNYCLYYIWNYFLVYLLIGFTLRKGKLKKVIHTEKPMLYSNIPLANIKYNMLTKEIITRKVSIPPKSCVFIDEASLMADSMLFKDEVTNEQISLFIKLYGHYSKGGFCNYNTQDLKDVHFGFKRCTSTMLWIHSKIKLPFITILRVRELISIADDQVQTENNFNEDVEKTCLWLVIPNKYYWNYDCYCYSALTDDLPRQVDYKTKKIKRRRFKKANLKTKYIPSFRIFKSFKNERKKDE